MVGNYAIHVFFILLSTLTGYSVASRLIDGANAYWGGLIGLLLGGGLVAFGVVLEKTAAKKLFWGSFGLIVGVLASGLLNLMLDPVFSQSPSLFLLWKGFSLLFFSYMGLILALKVEKEPGILFLGKRTAEPPAASNSKILDTSVIIDGRIADLCETGFLEGTYIIPQFILQELQHIADSSDSLKRARGRRGLDILHRIQKMVDIDVRIVDDDFPSIKDVDSKIVALGKRLSAKVVTNDLNLNKVAELQGVRVLNINQLCNALKPVVLPGETMRVFVLKEGKESGQGIAYLDDGTMIVVDEAKKWIGKNIDVVVTSVLQTTAGRMIFTRVREEEREEYQAVRAN
ncbi:MAG: TRAM domain-containing protein [Candidatus Manganitrophaceae bacterium]|nr:MAG: TRAM domain-containing protein [Candidatus Manganitrophaceae bacterium]